MFDAALCTSVGCRCKGVPGTAGNVALEVRLYGTKDASSIGGGSGDVSLLPCMVMFSSDTPFLIPCLSFGFFRSPLSEWDRDALLIDFTSFRGGQGTTVCGITCSLVLPVETAGDFGFHSDSSGVFKPFSSNSNLKDELLLKPKALNSASLGVGATSVRSLLPSGDWLFWVSVSP